MTKPLVTKVRLSDVVKTNAAVDMNSIVAFFISKYENNLLASKKALSGQINNLTTYLNNDFVELVKNEIKLTSFNVTVRSLGFKTIATVQINHSELEKKKSVLVIVNQQEKTETCTFRMIKQITISDTLHKTYLDKTAEIVDLRSQLQDVLDNLSNISRKERDVRGALAEKTLRDAGVGDLFDDSSLMDLVRVPTLSMKIVMEK